MEYVPPFVRAFMSSAKRAGRVERETPHGTRIVIDVWSKDTDLRFAEEEMAPLAVAVCAGLPFRPMVRIAFIACALPRTLPRTRGEPLAPVHVNGGVTYSGPKGPQIAVFRKEDACKVMVHELLHLYGFDAALLSRQHAVEPALMRRYGIVESVAGRFGLNECLTDLAACKLHAAWRSAKAVDVKFHLDAVAMRLLIHSQRLKGLGKGWGGGYRERTHAFCYYVCKAALWDRFPAALAAARDPVAFAALVDTALQEWSPGDGSFGTPFSSGSAPKPMGAFARYVAQTDSMRMTPPLEPRNQSARNTAPVARSPNPPNCRESPPQPPARRHHREPHPCVPAPGAPKQAAL